AVRCPEGIVTAGGRTLRVTSRIYRTTVGVGCIQGQGSGIVERTAGTCSVVEEDERYCAGWGLAACCGQSRGVVENRVAFIRTVGRIQRLHSVGCVVDIRCDRGRSNSDGQGLASSR